MSTAEMRLSYVTLYSDDDGETHFMDEEWVMAEKEYAPPAPPVWVGPWEKATGTTVIAIPPGWFGDYHAAPKYQWMLVMSGALEVIVSDGEKRTFETGAIVYVHDAGSKGHQTRSIGDEISVLMVTEVE